MIRPGVILGERYEVQERIGAGGMADVYKGRDQKLNRFVAIKVLKKEYREDDNFVRKFKTEAQSAAGLMHPNVVNVYDVGEDRGLYFMVMELVEGITLKEYIEKKGRLSSKEVISIGIQICNGVDAAHRHHIIHRDIKPQNIIISKEGKVKVTDFGIARVASSNTISSNAMGSVHYTSPEQARGGFSDEKSDIYSVGITMYEMATGRVPFDGETTVAIAIKHLQEDITPPSVYVPDIPFSLEQIILKCTQKSADKRYANATLLMMDLKRSLVDPEGAFVSLAPFVQGTDTVMLTDADMSRIQQMAEDYDEDDDYDEEDYDEEDYDEEDRDYEPRRKESHSSRDSDVNPKMAKVMKILAVVVAVIVIGVLIFAVGKTAGIFKSGIKDKTNAVNENSTKAKVPNIVGKKEADADKLLRKAGIGMKVVSRVESTKYEKGIVIEQKTVAGTKVEKKSYVEVVISSGKAAELVNVPDVTGLSESEAQSALKSAGLKIGETNYDYSDAVGASDVISTDPGANRQVAKDSKINILVSKGAKQEEKVSVPNIIGKSHSDASGVLSGKGLILGDVSEVYDANPAGTVISQSPSAGEKVTAGTSISVTISKGEKPADTTTVPSVIGITEADAKSAIKSAGLTPDVRYQESQEAAGVVIEQSIDGGEKVSPGQVITITVSKGPAKPTPPDDGGTQ